MTWIATRRRPYVAVWLMEQGLLSAEEAEEAHARMLKKRAGPVHRHPLLASHATSNLVSGLVSTLWYRRPFNQSQPSTQIRSTKSPDIRPGRDP